MMLSPTSTRRDIAFAVCTALDRAGIRAVLTGGSCAEIYAGPNFASHDADLVVSFGVSISQLSAVMARLGFTPARSRHIFVHPDLSFFTVEFLDPPLAVGKWNTPTVTTLHQNGLLLHLLSAEASACDRLASFLYFGDPQGLVTAAAVMRNAPANRNQVGEWLEREIKGSGIPDERIRRALTLLGS